MASMLMLLGDDDVNVQKKVILTVSSMFKLALAVSLQTLFMFYNIRFHLYHVVKKNSDIKEKNCTFCSG